MCAILGIAGKLPAQKKIEKARDAMSHRGPDDAGLYYSPEEGVALGHRRLSIIDLSEAGHQPFFSNDGRFVITFNGEIYNYLEIKKELDGKYDFKTQTDTEVLLASYIVWGEKCLQKFNGMFAFAIWDKKKRELFCARDHLGVKPFFYCYRNGALYFASEIRGLLALDILRKPNEKIIFEYLYHGLYDHRDETFFDGIKHLLPGHYLVWKNETINVSKYWDLSRVAGNKQVSFLDAQDELRALLADSIRIQYRSDVPVGVNLSSGLDSNSLFYYANKVTGGNTEAFTFCMESEEYNECSVLEETLSAREKTRWHKAHASPQGIWEAMGLMNSIQGEPYGGIPTVAYETLYKKAAEDKIIVLLEGQGGDELFAGYKYYLWEHEKDEGKGIGEKSLSYSQDKTPLTDRALLSKDFIAAHTEGNLSFQAPFGSHLLNAQYRDLVHTKLPRVLRMNDHVSMAYGRELRVPLLDYRIVEFCFSLPVEYKIKGGVQKYIMREAMKNIVPGTLLKKPKKAFGAIQNEWFRNYFRKEILRLLSSKTFRSRPYWDHNVLQDKTEKFFKGEGENSFFLWQCINLELWFGKFFD